MNRSDHHRSRAAGSPDDRRGPAASTVTRRQLLTAAAVSAGAVVAVGCSIPILTRSSAEADAAGTTGAGAGGGSSTPSSPAPPTTATTATTSTAAPPATPAGVEDIHAEHVDVTTADGVRTIRTASYPDWAIDAGFRYAGTPTTQDLTFTVTAEPAVAAALTEVVTGQVFGIHRNGVVFDPTTAEYFEGNRSGGWNENALPSFVDGHGGHTRPDGFYHLHLVTDAWVSDPTSHSAFTGWAADGFPIYLRYGYADPQDPTSGVVDLQPSYRLRSGSRPSGPGDPGGAYDGTYVADYEYVAGLGDLDECNGRWCVTPELPAGTYAYFLTDAWPSVPHWIRGTPDASFRPGFGGGSGPMGGGRS